MPILPKIFIAYAHEDKPLLQKLRTHLNVMKRQQHCEIFFDGEIMSGETWDKRLKDELHTAHIFVLLVTAEFLDSDYVNETELPKILERRMKGEAEVVAVIMKDCLWEMTELQHLQVVLYDGNPVEEYNAYAYAAREVFKVIMNQNNKLSSAKETIPFPVRRNPKHLSTEFGFDHENIESPGFNEIRRAGDKALFGVSLYDPFHDLMLPIQGGNFRMGGTRPVPLKDFHLCKHPVTHAQWRVIMDSDPSKMAFIGSNDCPVEKVSWEDVQVFIKKLNVKTGENYRLSSEAEWEFAARGGKKSRKYNYAGSDDLDEVGWFWENSGGIKLSGDWDRDNIIKNNCQTHPVMQKKVNVLGLYDMSGNVWEWCQDTWHDSLAGVPKDGSAWTSGGDQTRRVVRGGAWFNDARNCPIGVSRAGRDIDSRSLGIGFRLAR